MPSNTDERPHIGPEALSPELLEQASRGCHRPFSLTEEQLLAVAGVPIPSYDFGTRRWSRPAWDAAARRWHLVEEPETAR